MRVKEIIEKLKEIDEEGNRLVSITQEGKRLFYIKRVYVDEENEVIISGA